MSSKPDKMRVYLDIPFNELELAKSHGVKFDLDKRMWFIQDHPTMKFVYDDPDQHLFILLFGKWFANKMKKVKHERVKYRKHVVTQPRTPRKKNKKSR